jgi:hypothetical protein
MILSQKQLGTKAKIELLAHLFDLDPKWASAIAMAESSLGKFQKSRTNCRGVFQMSSIAMQDLLLSMEKSDDDLVDIVCGLAFLKLLMTRWKTLEEATLHFCDPMDRGFYLNRVKDYMAAFENPNLGGSNV